jgi:hypothetical protein
MPGHPFDVGTLRDKLKGGEIAVNLRLVMALEPVDLRAVKRQAARLKAAVIREQLAGQVDTGQNAETKQRR